ncbi:MAG: response regulator [Gemmatimonadetes bacterium]|nr:response regulator [Gemmatimonadota bacterium]
MSRILLADGDVYSCGFIYRILTKKRVGTSVEVVNDGFCAYDRMLSKEYDLAIIDESLPNLSGLNVIRKLREVGKNTKIIMLSDRADPLMAKEALLNGAQDLIEKPILLDSFVYSLYRNMRDEKSNLYEWVQKLNWPKANKIRP